MAKTREEAAAYTRAYSAANAEKIKARKHAYYIAHSEVYKANSAAAYIAHPGRTAANRRKWRAANPERDHEHARRDRQAHPERLTAGKLRRRAATALAPGTASAEAIQARRDYYGGRCWLPWCDAPGTALDHVKPLSKGGSNWPSNLRPICPLCNSSKCAKWPLSMFMNPVSTKEIAA